MRRAVYFFTPIVLLLVGFYVWHTPMRGPLTEAEIDAFIASQAEKGGTVWTSEEAFEAFLRNDDGRPFVMINLMEFRERAQYSDENASNTDMTGEEAGVIYGQSVLPQLLIRGSYPISRAARHNTIINSVGQQAGEFDSFAMVRYRSRRDLIDMIGSEGFQAAEIHKWASLENTLVAPSNHLASLQVVGYLPYFLVVFVAGFFSRALFSRS
ncbi:MAG: hypothetical protein AAGG69_14370 [Pseudomonadota bacterium]